MRKNIDPDRIVRIVVTDRPERIRDDGLLPTMMTYPDVGWSHTHGLFVHVHDGIPCRIQTWNYRRLNKIERAFKLLREHGPVEALRRLKPPVFEIVLPDRSILVDGAELARNK